jgi:hypothetical protein
MAIRNGEKKEGDQYDAYNWPGGNKFDSQAKELFLPFRCFCKRKEVISAACFIFKSPFH